jgi:hypothetical protein
MSITFTFHLLYLLIIGINSIEDENLKNEKLK